jgi:hypothetical protein
MLNNEFRTAEVELARTITSTFIILNSAVPKPFIKLM